MQLTVAGGPLDTVHLFTEALGKSPVPLRAYNALNLAMRMERERFLGAA